MFMYSKQCSISNNVSTIFYPTNSILYISNIWMCFLIILKYRLFTQYRGEWEKQAIWPAIFSIEVKQFFIVSWQSVLCIYIFSIYQAYQFITRALLLLLLLYILHVYATSELYSKRILGLCSICFFVLYSSSLCWLVRIYRDSMQWWFTENINTGRLEIWEDFSQGLAIRHYV